MPDFNPGQLYKRAHVREALGLDPKGKGGPIDTGYFEHGGEYFIFCGIGASGKTGHNYGNKWVVEGRELQWYGKPNTTETQPQIRDMISGGWIVHLFWRSDNADAFTYAGRVRKKQVVGGKPVEIIWSVDPDELIFPEDLPPATHPHYEGMVKRVQVNAYERNPEARAECLKIHGMACSVCSFDFGKVYGQHGVGYIHVHHLTPISSIGRTYEINPEQDLRPVCPNCHAMIHKKGNPPLAIEELKALMAAHRAKETK